MKHSHTDDEREDLRRAANYKETLEWPKVSRKYFFLLNDYTFSLYVGNEFAFHYDAEGRLRRAFVSGTHYQRGLDGKVLRKIKHRARTPQVNVPPQYEEVEALFDISYASAIEALSELEEGLHRGDFSLGIHTAVRARQLLGLVVRYDTSRLLDEAERFRNAYAPLGILPPDCYRNLILQVTVGCAYNRCAFCSIYEDIGYQQKTIEELQDHITKVRAFLGKALPLRRGVFLGEANALEIPQADLVAVLETVQELVPEVLGSDSRHGGAIHAFTDVFRDRTKGPSEFAALRELGLGRVYLGIESGNEAVLKRLKKPSNRAAIRQRVADLKAGGVPVGLIFLVGAGGRDMNQAHIDDTVDLVKELDLDSRDLIYLSPLTWPTPQDPVPPPQHDMATIHLLSATELEAEEDEIADRIRDLGIHVGHYDLRSFIYY